MSRRACLHGLVLGAVMGLVPAASAQPPAASFSHGDVVNRARALAERPFDPTIPELPPELRDLDYDKYRAIRFRAENPLWRAGDGAFQLHLFHLGFLHTRPVEINVVTDGVAIPIPFQPGLFQYGKSPTPQSAPVGLGFAGAAITTTLNDQRKQDEVISFLGASYFRFLARDQHYGLSARSLALDVGAPEPEEFPFFRALWIERPAPDADKVTIHALLDSPSVAGAYRFTVAPGRQTAVDVAATIFPRRTLRRVGIAPLTSMYFLGEGDLEPRPDFRPEIHDSDGLMMLTGAGEWIWRPLRNPRDLSISQFFDFNPRGFGLMQRDRDFGNYQDLEAHYHMRPGYWVEPQGEWGAGRVELVEIPTDNEAMDNIVSYWTPEKPMEPGGSYDIRYRLTAHGDTAGLNAFGQTRHSFGPLPVPGVETIQGSFVRRFIVDFGAGDLAHYLSEPAAVAAVASISAGRVMRAIVQPNPAIKGFRVITDVQFKPGDAGDLRIFLKARGRALTETWTYPLSEPARLPVSDAAEDAGPGP